MNQTVLTPDLWITALKSMGMLFIVLSVLIAGLYGMKRLFYLGGNYSQSGVIKTLSSRYIAPKERIMLIEVLGEKILIGVTPQSINCLARIDQNGKFEIKSDDTSSGFFRNILKGQRNKEEKFRTSEISND